MVQVGLERWMDLPISWIVRLNLIKMNLNLIGTPDSLQMLPLYLTKKKTADVINLCLHLLVMMKFQNYNCH